MDIWIVSTFGTPLILILSSIQRPPSLIQFQEVPRHAEINTKANHRVPASLHTPTRGKMHIVTEATPLIILLSHMVTALET